MHRLHARRIGLSRRPRDQGRGRAQPRQGGRDRVALLARGAVADEAHRIDRLVGRPARHQRAPPRERRLRPEILLNGADDLHRLGHAPEAAFVLGERARIGPDPPHAARFQGFHVRDGGIVAPHAVVHRGGHQHRLVGGEQHRRGEIVGDALRHFGEDIRRRRGHDEQIGLLREPQMAHLRLVGQRKDVGINLLMAERRDRQRRHELRPAFGQDAAHRAAALAQPPDQLQRLVGRDPAGDDQQNPLARKRLWDVAQIHHLKI